MLKLSIKRISPTHHTLRYVREDGSGEEKAFESKSTLLHDFMHLAIESEAQLMHGFFGLLTQGYSYDELAGKAPSQYPEEEAMNVEMVVGPFSAITKGKATATQLIEGLGNLFGAHGKPVPSWVTSGMLDRAYQRYQCILGKWNSLKYGETLELEFGV